MTRYGLRKSYKAIIVVALAIALALSANVALAAPKLMDVESTTLQLQPTPQAGDATCQIEFETVTGADGAAAVQFRTQIEGLDNTENLVLVVVDEEGDESQGGMLDEEGNVQIPVENLEDFAVIGIARPTDSGGAEILFIGELPEGEQPENQQ